MDYSKTGCVYIHTNVISGKSYVGLTTRDMESRLKQHYNDANKGSSLHFHKALRKYDKDTWISKVLEDNIPIQRLALTEKFYIAKYNTYEKGYNLTTGGDSFDHMGMIDKLRKANIGKKATEKTKVKMSRARIGTKGSSFKPWWYMNPDGIVVEVDDMTQKDFCKLFGFNYKSISSLNHGKVVEQGPMKGWVFGKGTLDDIEWVSIVKPKRKSPTTKGKPRDCSFNHKRVGQYNKDTEELIMEYPSAKVAGESLGLKSSAQIVRAARGERRVGAGYIWKYL